MSLWRIIVQFINTVVPLVMVTVQQLWLLYFFNEIIVLFFTKSIGVNYM